MKGDNSLLKNEWIETSQDALDEEWLYINWDGQNNLPLIPIFIIGETPANIQNACYFYNRIEKGKTSTKYVSYHFEMFPEKEENNTEAWEMICRLL